ncbi:MAG: hypothetical protein GEU28_04115 [Dehalococcoidia bacterium]|nr:hypothetical protein [Dehalococcoidia bacterium]
MKFAFVLAAAIAVAALSTATGSDSARAAANLPGVDTGQEVAPAALNPQIWSPLEKQMHRLHNRARLRNDLPPVRATNPLGRLAAYRCRQIKTNFSHDGFPQALQRFGVQARWAGENIARNFYPRNQTVQFTFDQWMGSAGHRGNILNPRYDRVGIGHCTKWNGENFWVAVFIG